MTEKNKEIQILNNKLHTYGTKAAETETKENNQKAKVFAVYNQKGGVGKTTTKFNLAVGLARFSNRVLIIDTDVQGNLTQNCGFLEKSKLKKSLPNLFLSLLNNIDEDSDELIPLDKEYVYEEIIDLSKFEGNKFGNLSIIPMSSNRKMSTVLEYMSVGAKESKELFLKTAIKSVEYDFDVIIIDCPSSYELATTNALVAADYLIVPMKPEFFSGKGIEGLISIWQNIRKKFNANLQIAGILVTMFESNLKAHQEVLGEIKNECKDKIKIFDSIIAKSSKVSEKQSLGTHILDEKRNKVAETYNSFVCEVLKILGGSNVGGDKNDEY